MSRLQDSVTLNILAFRYSSREKHQVALESIEQVQILILPLLGSEDVTVITHYASQCLFPHE